MCAKICMILTSNEKTYSASRCWENALFFFPFLTIPFGWIHVSVISKELRGNGDCLQRKRMPQKSQRKVCNLNIMNSVAEAYVLNALRSILVQYHDLRHGRWMLLRSARQLQKNLLQRSLDKGMWMGHIDIPSVTHSKMFKYCRITFLFFFFFLLYSNSLLVLHVKCSSVSMSIPNSLRIPSSAPVTSFFQCVNLFVFSKYIHLYHSFLDSMYKECHLIFLLLCLTDHSQYENL